MLGRGRTAGATDRAEVRELDIRGILGLTRWAHSLKGVGVDATHQPEWEEIQGGVLHLGGRKVPAVAPKLLLQRHVPSIRAPHTHPHFLPGLWTKPQESLARPGPTAPLQPGNII